MKLTFYTNYLNHHQLPFCKEMFKLIGKDFSFVAHVPIRKERLLMGYEDMNNEFPFVLRAYDSKDEYLKAKKLALDSDVIILGSAPNEYVDIRMKKNKLTFRYTERFLKKGLYRSFIPTTRKKIFNNYIRYKELNFYVLCASAYTAYDLSLCGMESNTLKWGYFPKVEEYSVDELMKRKKNKKLKLLWVGRLINFKKAKDAIKITKTLKDKGYHFDLDIVGTGESEVNLKKLVKAYNLSDCVSFLGSMSPEEVRKHMEEANIFLFTSNFQEGWGAVLNEAMNSACAIVASHAIGSVPYLLKHKKNGLIYKYGDNKDFYNKVKFLIDNPEKQKEYGKEAYCTLYNTWNAKVAADRFINISQQLLNGKQIKGYDDGPCSKASIIKNDWFKE